MKYALAIIIVLLPGLVLAQVPMQSINFGNTCPGPSPICQSVFPRKIITFDFTGQTIPSVATFSRASTGWYFNSSGLLTSAANDTPRFDYGQPGSSTLFGLLLEPSETNFILYSRDLTQTAWSLTNAITAVDQTGIDGTATSASSITATATNATVCQPITHSNGCSYGTAYLKRVSGTGTVSMSLDGGTTYTAQTITSNWARYSVGEKIFSNPQLCFQIGTSGDEVAVDVAQVEISTPAAHCSFTSPIITTTATVTRAADVSTITPTPWYSSAGGVFLLQFRQLNLGQSVVSFAGFSNGVSVGVNNGTTQSPQNAGTPNYSSINISGSTWGGSYVSGASNGVTYTATGTVSPTVTSLNFASGGQYWLQKLTYYNYGITAAQLGALTR